VIFVDANVPMFLLGRDHVHRTDAQVALERLAVARVRLVTSAEVLQEILHRYVSTRHHELVQPAFDLVSALVDEVLPVTAEDVDDARDLVLGRPTLTARDALHVAVMRRHRVAKILTYDRGFDDLPGIERVS